MKLCMIMYTFSMGGFTASVLPMLKYLSEQGVQVELLLFEKSNVPLPEYDGLTVTFNNNPRDEWKKWARFFTNPYYMYRFARSILDRGKHPELMGKWMQVLFYLEISRYRPHDLTAFDCVVAWEECFPTYYLSKIVKAKRKVSVFHTDYEIAKMDPHMEKIGCRNIDKIITVSKATQDVLRRMLPFYRDKIGNFRNVLDVEKITRLGDALLVESMQECAQKRTKVSQSDANNAQNVPFPKGAFDCITVCRLDNVSKALDRLVRICARLKADGLSFRWYLVGDGPYRQTLETLIAQGNLQDTVILLGAKTNPHPYTKHADLFVLQSYYEGKPISVDEALILGTPALVSHYKSAYEQIVEGENGFIAENNENSIYETLKYLIQHPETVTAVREKLATQDLARFTDTQSFMAHLVP